MRFFIATLVFLCICQPSYAQSTDEKKLKSVYLVNFARFTTWHSGESGTVSLCIFEEATIFDNIKGLNGLKIDENRVIEVVSNPVDIRVCNMIYWDNATMKYREYEPGAEVLEVTDSQVSFNQDMEVLVYLNENKLRFYISENMVSHAEFKLSSKLLRLSKLPKQLVNQAYGFVYADIRTKETCV